MLQLAEHKYLDHPWHCTPAPLSVAIREHRYAAPDVHEILPSEGASPAHPVRADSSR